jgi:cytoskeletal protein CcmA (bactofilin family)
MAKKRSDFADSKNPDTLIGLGVAVEGELETEGDIQINGWFKGDVATSGDVIIGDHAEVKANVSGNNIYVAGSVHGNLLATEKIEIYETGRVTGNVEAHGLVIEPGGLLTGKSIMKAEEVEQPDAAPTFELEDKEEEES